MYVWYRRRPTSVVLLNFDNPVYRRTVEDADMDPFTPRTHRNPIHFLIYRNHEMKALGVWRMSAMDM